MNGQNFGNAGGTYKGIAHDVVRLVGDDKYPIWVYMEAGDGWLQPSIFQNRPEVVQWCGSDPEFFELVMDAWYAQNIEMRWATMEMEIDDGRFKTRFRYPGEVDPDGINAGERRQLLLDTRYGDKAVIYPD